MDETSKFIFGDLETSQSLQSQMTALQTKLASMGPNDPNRQALILRLQNLRQTLESEMMKQGATDASGRLIAAKDVQGDYLNKDYLELLKQQNAQQSAGAMAQGLKSARQAQMAGTGGPGDIRSVMSKVENIQRNANQDLAGQVYAEQNQAYGRAGQELGRKQAYATQLTDTERNAIIDTLTQQMNDFDMTTGQINSMQRQLANMPEGLLQKLITGGADLFGKWVSAKLANSEKGE